MPVLPVPVWAPVTNNVRWLLRKENGGKNGETFPAANWPIANLEPNGLLEDSVCFNELGKHRVALKRDHLLQGSF